MAYTKGSYAFTPFDSDLPIFTSWVGQNRLIERPIGIESAA